MFVKKRLALWFIVAFLMTIVAPVAAIAADPISFPDANLEAVIRGSIHKISGNIYLSDVQNITELNAGDKGIVNIDGLEYLSNLEAVWLYDNDISDITPLKDLTKLNTLGLCNNKVSDASALSGLTELTFLSLYNNKVQDISALQNLNKLQTLKLANNQIIDYSPIYNIYNNLKEKDFSINNSSTSSHNMLPASQANNGDTVNLLVNGKALQADVPPQLINGRTMVPVRFVAESLGITVDFDSSSNTIIATKGVTVVKLIINGKAFKNGEEIPLDVPAILLNGRTMVPVRFICEAFDTNVTWDETTRTVCIGSSGINSSNQTAEQAPSEAGIKAKANYDNQLRQNEVYKIRNQILNQSLPVKIPTLPLH